MDTSRAIEILEHHRAQIVALRAKDMTHTDFIKWKRDTEVALQRIFGDTSRHFSDFAEIRYYPSVMSSSTRDSATREAYARGLDRADSILASIVDEIKEYDIASDSPPVPDKMALLEIMLLRFQIVARQLCIRHGNRSTLTIDDEYDVQDLLHALLRLHFDDVRAEEWTPSYAGGASRVDFLLKNEKIVVEAKKTRNGLTTPDIGAQLLVDIARYQNHPDCDCLVCFIYDPEGRVRNPAGLEADLEKCNSDIRVRAIVCPKGV